MKPLLFAISTALIFLVQCTDKKKNHPEESTTPNTQEEIIQEEVQRTEETTTLKPSDSLEKGDSPEATSEEGPDSTTIDSSAKAKKLENTQPIPGDNLLDKKEELQQKVIKEAPKPGDMNDDLKRIKEEKNKVKK